MIVLLVYQDPPPSPLLLQPTATRSRSMCATCCIRCQLLRADGRSCSKQARQPSLLLHSPCVTCYLHACTAFRVLCCMHRPHITSFPLSSRTHTRIATTSSLWARLNAAATRSSSNDSAPIGISPSMSSASSPDVKAQGSLNLASTAPNPIPHLLTAGPSPAGGSLDQVRSAPPHLPPQHTHTLASGACVVTCEFQGGVGQ